MSLGLLALAAGAYELNPAALAFGCVFLLGPLGLRLAIARQLKKIVVIQFGPETARDGERLEIGVRVENRSRAPIFFPRFTEIFGPEDDVQKEILFPDRLDAGESYTRSYQGLCRSGRGYYSYGPSALVISDPLGWFELRRFLRADWALRVHPRTRPCRMPPSLRGAGELQTTSRALRRVGQSDEPWSVRPYRHGDSARRIHWPLSARHAELVVRESCAAASGDDQLLLDLDQAAGVGEGRGAAYEEMITVAASLALHGLREGRRVGLSAGSEGPRIPCNRGEAQLTALMNELSSLQPSERDGFGELIASARQGASAARPVLLLLPYLFGNESIQAAIGQLPSEALIILVLRKAQAEQLREAQHLARRLRHRDRKVLLSTQVCPGSQESRR